ncbi:MAG: hypothetical protein KKA07_12870, partial [Bacteroidetes bacterium]|nr:hypothetical protein [Bacteroidota bacterium]
AIYYFSLHYWDFASVKSVRKMQLRKFRRIFEYAKKHSKFYRDLYGDHGVLDLKIRSWADIEKVPVINKAIIRKYSTRDFMTCDINKSINIHSTSGSTGEPFQIAYSKYEDYSSHVRLTKNLMSFGYRPFKKLALLSRYEPGHKFEVEDDIRGISVLQKKLKLFPKEVISIFEPIDVIIEKLQKMNPYILWSTPSFIHLLAIELEKQNQRLNIPICFLMAETISYDQMDLFKKRVCIDIADVYGSMESPSVGFSKNSIDYKKIVVNSSLTEVVNHREMNGSRVGDIIVTNLINKTMPFIRYDLGDYVGVLDDETFPTKKIGRVFGRFEDILYFGSDSSLSFHQTYQLFHDFHEIEQYKFLQLPNGEIVLQLRVKSDTDKAEVGKKAIEIWDEKFSGVPLKVEFKDKFEIDKKTGKFKVLEKIKA